mmetsp:Transcript_27814/g.75667  ORF Transcript_27814/g.75667 Transcript_27814/m.75667 type:complete len:581 (+) Transcript_27814:98-1840(+)
MLVRLCVRLFVPSFEDGLSYWCSLDLFRFVLHRCVCFWFLFFCFLFLSLAADPFRHELGPEPGGPGGIVPDRPGNVDVGKGNGLGVDKVLQKEPGRDGSAPSGSAVLDVGNVGLELFFVGLDQRQPPGGFSRGLRDGLELLGQVVVFGKDGADLLPECHHTGPGERRQLDDFLAAQLLVAVDQGVRQRQASLRIRVEDLDRDPVRGHQNVAGHDAPVVDHVLAGRHHKVALHAGGLQGPDGPGGAQYRGGAATVELHELHHGRLDVVPARVKEESLPDQAEFLCGCWCCCCCCCCCCAFRRLVGEVNELRGRLAGPGHAQIGSHAPLLAVVLVEDVAGDAAVLALGSNGLGQIRERERVEDVVGGVDNVLGDVDAPDDGFGLVDGALAGSSCFVIAVGDQGHRLEVLVGDHDLVDLVQRSAVPVRVVQARIYRNGELPHKVLRVEASGKQHHHGIHARRCLVLALGNDGASNGPAGRRGTGTSTGTSSVFFAETDQDVSRGFGFGFFRGIKDPHGGSRGSELGSVLVFPGVFLEDQRQGRGGGLVELARGFPESLGRGKVADKDQVGVGSSGGRGGWSGE